jgi:tetratricopeptide (TPR) repeat protein
MKKGAAVLVIGLVFVLFAVGARAGSARDLNTEGYRLYQAGNYPEALKYFRRAVTADPGYSLAHYNLACTLGVLRKAGGESICVYDAYKSAILDELEAAVRLDPETLMKMTTDTDLDPIRDTLRYQRLVGVVPDSGDNVRTILVAVSWFGPAPGAFGPTSGIRFAEDGSLVLWTLDTAGDEVKRIEYRGSWSVTANRITIVLDEPLGDATEFFGTMLPGGTVDVPGLPGPFSDDPAECEA